MKPFNLDEALSGKPVKLRDGSKAYVLGRYPKTLDIDYPLIGISVSVSKSGVEIVNCDETWTLNGVYNIGSSSLSDIVGMWEEAPTIKYRHINGYKFPEPCSEPLENGQPYFMPMIKDIATIGRFDWRNDGYDRDRLKRGFVHATQEAAQAHADAINNLFRGEPCFD